MAEYFDLTQAIRTGMPIVPGDPSPEIRDAADVPLPWRVTELLLGTHTGTHVDAASHYCPDGKTIDQYPVARFLVPALMGVATGLSENEVIRVQTLEGVLADMPKGGGLLIRTSWDVHWGTESYLHHPYVAEEAAHAIVSAGVGLVGIDALNVDSTTGGGEQVHEILLGNDVLIVENLRGLHQLNPSVLYQLSVLPLSLPNLDGSPVRAVAWEREG